MYEMLRPSTVLYRKCNHFRFYTNSNVKRFHLAKARLGVKCIYQIYDRVRLLAKTSNLHKGDKCQSVMQFPVDFVRLWLVFLTS